MLPVQLHSWGFFAHEQINTLAVFILPEPMFGFYRSHYSELAELAVKADMRRYIVENEGARHYIDIDQYEEALPLDTVAVHFDSACSIYGEEFLAEHGIAPWNIIRLKCALSKAFELSDRSAILRLSADLGHYIGDIHVPLHTHSNYNGQQTGQHGIHALWESRLPEKYFDRYDLYTRQANYWENVSDSVWRIIESSHELVRQVLNLELHTRNSLDESARFTYEMRNGTSFRNYSSKYLKRYNAGLGDMVERRMRSAIHSVASLWFTAWVDAGQPVLSIEGEIRKDSAISTIDRLDSAIQRLQKKLSGRTKIH